MSAQDTKRIALKYSLLAILSAFVVETTIGITSGSLALVTDGMHALLDSVVTIVFLVAIKFSMKPPDKEHTYGHGKIESLGVFIGGICMLLISAYFIYESASRMGSQLEGGTQIVPGMIAVYGGIYTICADAFRIGVLTKANRKSHGDAVKSDLYHAIMDAASTMIAIIGILAVNLWGFYQGDLIAALLLGVVLAILSFKITYRNALELIDTIPPKLVREVEETVRNTQGIVDLKNLMMRRAGNEVFVDIIVSLRADVSFEKAHEITTSVERNIKNKVPNSKINVHFEPAWSEVTLEFLVTRLAMSISGVKSVHNVMTSYSNNKNDAYISLHLMVDKNNDLKAAHKIADTVESMLQEKIPKIANVSIHLEPYVSVPVNTNPQQEAEYENQIKNIVNKYPEVRSVEKVITLKLQNVFKIDIHCSFDGHLSIEKVHDVTSKIERNVKQYFQEAIITIHPEPATTI